MFNRTEWMTGAAAAADESGAKYTRRRRRRRRPFFVCFVQYLSYCFALLCCCSSGELSSCLFYIRAEPFSHCHFLLLADLQLLLLPCNEQRGLYSSFNNVKRFSFLLLLLLPLLL